MTPASPTPRRPSGKLVEEAGITSTRSAPACGSATPVSAAAEPLLPRLLAGMRGQAAAGVRQFGTVVTRPTVVRLVGDRASVVDCQDASRSGVVYARTGLPNSVGSPRTAVFRGAGPRRAGGVAGVGGPVPGRPVLTGGGPGVAAAGAGSPGSAPGVAAPSPGPAQRLGRLLVVGAHGGAGVSTLAWLLAPAVGLGRARDWRRLVNPGRCPVVLVCRCAVPATGRAVGEVAAAAAAGVGVAVVVGDGWPVPGAARARLRLLAAQVGRVVRVPYVPGWRYVERPDPAGLPRAVVLAVAAVRAAVDEPSRR